LIKSGKLEATEAHLNPPSCFNEILALTSPLDMQEIETIKEAIQEVIRLYKLQHQRLLSLLKMVMLNLQHYQI
jgi:hypothetical protein